MRGRSRLPGAGLRPVRDLRGHRRDRLEPDAADQRRGQRRCCGKLGLGSRWRSDWLSDPDIAIWTLMVIITWKYIGFAVILFLAGAAEHPGRAVRGRRDRRRELLADPAAHHAAAARPDHPDLGVPVDHRLAAAVRPRLHHLGPVRRRHRRRLDHGDVHGHRRPRRRELRLRQRGRRRPVRHLARRSPCCTSASSSAVTPPAPSPKGALRWPTTIRSPAAPPTARRANAKRSRWGSPGHLLRSRCCSSRVTIAPVLYIILGGFRTNSQITAEPGRAARPRGSCSNYVDVLTQLDVLARGGNSTIVALGTTIGGRRARPDGELRARPLPVPRPRRALRAASPPA